MLHIYIEISLMSFGYPEFGSNNPACVRKKETLFTLAHLEIFNRILIP